ncbi:uncharacterized protein [Pseudorasbora parva]|uniref:uncharacterized protein n=1 Tax=Pseudorasbora parva TaxID=51549 RepID=UPI00351F2FA4
MISVEIFSNMKNFVLFFLISFFIEADPVKTDPVSVMEGDSVTLKTAVNEILKYDVIQWRFGYQNSPLAEINRKVGLLSLYVGPDERFRDRLQMDYLTGSLTIRNIGTEHSGLYEVDISNSKHTIYKSFSVTVRGPGTGSGSGLSAGALVGICVSVPVFGALALVAAAAVIYYRCCISELQIQMPKTLAVIEGESVSLIPDDGTEIHKADNISWFYRTFLIAKRKGTNVETFDNGLPIFKDKLQLDKDSGSLTITNITTTNSGDYELWISRARHASMKIFSVCVCDNYDDIKTVSGKEGESVKLKTGVTEVPEGEEIQWKFGLEGPLIAQIKEGIETNSSGFRLDQTGSLTIENIRPQHTGLYVLNIIQSEKTSMKYFMVKLNRDHNPEDDGNNPDWTPLVCV